MAEELITLFAQYGVPKEILTDQGTNFTSQLLQILYKLLGVKPIRTKPYHPQMDGLVERFNKTLKDLLRKSYKEKDESGKNIYPMFYLLIVKYRRNQQDSVHLNSSLDEMFEDLWIY